MSVFVRDLRNKIYKILTPITTIKKLQEIWPEGEQFYSDLAEPLVTDIVSRKEINEVSKALGLKR